MISKLDLTQEIWDRIRNILKTRKISQVNLERLCENQGYRVTQPEISKLNSGNSQLTLYQLIAVSKALDVPIEQLVYPNVLSGKIHISGGSFITNPDEREFEGYLGCYYVVFHSTDQYTDKFLYGKLTFQKDISQICKAEFELDTGEVDKWKKPVLKKYHGQLLISNLLGIGYCILINEEIGEISNIEIRHRTFLIKEVECRLGLVLTASSGERKRPVIHRCFFARCPITYKLLEKIMPFLKLTIETGEVLVNRKILESSADKELMSRLDVNMLIEKSTVEEYIKIDKGLIRLINPKLSNQEVEEILNILKGGSGVYTSYIDESEDSQSYAILQKYRMGEVDYENERD